MRILGWYVPVLILVFGGAVAIERQVLLARMERRIDIELNDRARDMQREASDTSPSAASLFDRYARARRPATTDVDLLIQRGAVARQQGGDSLDGAEVRAIVRAVSGRGLPARGTVTTDESRIRWVAVAIVEPRGRSTFVAAADASASYRDIADAVRVVTAISFSVLAVTSVLAWLVAGRALAPVRSLTDTARRIGERDLTQRIEVSGDDELAELARTFNAMLDRLEAAFRHNREFLNDVSHELRTPITIVRGNLEVMGDDPEDRRQTVALVTDELDRMARLVEDLLLLARAEQRADLARRPLRLDDITRDVFAKVQALGPREWSLVASANAEVLADRDRLVQAVMNLAANAVAHTEEGTRIEIGAAVEGDRAKLWVKDEGPGIPYEAQQRIFERFARLNGARRAGTGLGLAIVRAVAEGHGGSVELKSAPGQGATFTVVLPIAETSTR